MMLVFRLGLFVGLTLAMSYQVNAKVTVEPSDRGAIVSVDGELFAEYLTQHAHQPCIWPLIGPTGKAMTRAYPIGPKVDGESHDHPHHHSFWFTHGNVNGYDFWGNTVKQSDGKSSDRIVHRQFTALENIDQHAKIVTINDWMHGDEKVCEDEREFVFGAGDDSRWIDCRLTLKATDGDVVFGDTKEGSFAVRVADTMKVDANLGGVIINREGLTNENAWGVPSRWVDYSGPVEGEPVGIAMLSHPKSFRPEVRWHVRTYGLFAANPFGQHDFPSPGLQQGEYTLKNGDELTLRYRVLLHTGDALHGKVEEAYRDYAGQP